MSFQRFSYKNGDELKAQMKELGVSLPWSDDLSTLLQPVTAGSLKLKNRMVCQPMEGNDGDLNGAPTDFTRKRYVDLAAGGAAIVWMESLAVSPNSATGPTMLRLSEKTVDKYKALLDEMRAACADAPPVIVAQLTHCGRFARLEDVPPVAAHENPHLPGEPRILTDQELDTIIEDYVAAAVLAEKAGFDAVDVRACHGYLLSESLSSFTRPGKYGGSFENRCRMVLDIVDGIAKATSIPMVTRLNAYDIVPKPYGWGTNEDGTPNLEEPIKLVKLMYDRGVRLFNISATVGPFFPHLQRPSDNPKESDGTHQLVHTELMHSFARDIKAACPEATVIASAFTWPRQYGANLAAGGIEAGWYDMAGWGRQTYAYPDFPADIAAGGLKGSKCCVSCSHCVTLMAHHEYTGCVVRNSQIYMPLFKAIQSPGKE